MSARIPRLVIGGVQTGSGKTTVTLALMRALTRRGLTVQGFKAGPDFIDPSYHAFVTGRSARNLDTWMMPRDALLELFQRATATADVAIIEGVMGLFDGLDPVEETGSTGHLAKMLDAPVLLVVDCWTIARSAAAIVQGFRDFDPEVRIAGVILNNVGGDRHISMMRKSIEVLCGVPVLGGLLRDGEFALPERHLGLVPQGEHKANLSQFDRLADTFEAHVNVDAILELARSVDSPPDFTPSLFSGPPQQTGPGPKIAVAHDEAFCFYYEDNLDLLRQAGAELITFSPLKDQGVPEEADLIYIGGGFPEVFAEALSNNTSMRESLSDFAAASKAVYAECGGLMYLAQSIDTPEGRSFPMVGVLPLRVQMRRTLTACSYLEATATADSPLLRDGEVARGHEFHYSTYDCLSPVAYGLEVKGLSNTSKPDGIVAGSVIASYLHLHFASFPALALRFVEWARG